MQSAPVDGVLGNCTEEMGPDPVDSSCIDLTRIFLYRGVRSHFAS